MHDLGRVAQAIVRTIEGDDPDALALGVGRAAGLETGDQVPAERRDTAVPWHVRGEDRQ
jgi:hypothetical protein